MPLRRLQELDLELMLGLYHLRYLTVVQVRNLWAPDRSHEAVRKWLGRLETAGMLRLMRTNGMDTRIVQLAGTGYRALSEHRAGIFRYTRSLGPHFLPHHLAVNDVFATLIRQTPVVWSALPWRWLTKVYLHWQERRRDEFGTMQVRRAILWPDAVVEVPGTSRVFIELDRSTECLRESDERRSIRRKLKGYASVLLDMPRRTGDVKQHSIVVDDVAPVLLFILTQDDRRQGNRRKKSILHAARELDFRLSVQCLYADEIDAIRRACTSGPPQAEPSSDAPGANLVLTAAEACDLQRLYRLAISLVPRTPENIDVTQAARRVLMRLHKAAQT